jgi:hypothetical protein
MDRRGSGGNPGAATSLQRIVGIRERSNWYFLYATHVRSLATHLKYADSPNVEEFGKKYAALEETMEEKWSTIGHSGAAPSGRRAPARSAGKKTK